MSLIPLPFWLMLPALCALGAWVLGWLAVRTTRNQQLRDILLASFWVRVGLAAVLFFISDLGWPVLKSLQMGHGLWSFGGDAQAYHAYGQTMSQSWWRGESAILPEARIFPYSFVVAVIYWLFGPHLLHGVLFNAWCGAVCGLLAYLIAGRCGGDRARMPAALLVAFWPSSFLWTAQLMKDSLTWCTTLAALYFSIRWCQEASDSHQPGMGRRAWSWVGLVFTVTTVTVIRYYVGLALLAATGIVVSVSLVIAACRRQFSGQLRLVGLPATVAFAVLLPSIVLLVPVELRRWNGHGGNGVPDGAVPVQQTSDGLRLSERPGTQPEAVVMGEAARLWNAMHPNTLIQQRRGFVTTGGHALIDGEREVSDTGALLHYLPRGVIVALLAPFPPQWFDRTGSTGLMRLWSSLEMIFIYAGVAFLLWSRGVGVVAVLERGRRGGLLLLAFTILLMIQVGVVVANIGTLFRLRLLFLFPFLIIVAAGAGCAKPYSDSTIPGKAVVPWITRTYTKFLQRGSLGPTQGMRGRSS